MDALVCETCDRPAVWHVNDLQEIEPRADANGQLWVQHEIKESHVFCDEHQRASRTYARDGCLTREVWLNEMDGETLHSVCDADRF